MSCYLLHFSVDYCLYEALSSWDCLSLPCTSYSPVFLFREAVFCAITVSYTIQYLSSFHNYLGSNKCSVNNNFHFSCECLVSYCSSVWTTVCIKHYLLVNVYIFTLHVIFLFAPFRKSCALCDNCLVYSTYLVSNKYLGSNNCSVENKFHLLVNVSFPSALLFRQLSVWNIIQF